MVAQENEKLVGKLKDLVQKYRELQARAKTVQEQLKEKEDQEEAVATRTREVVSAAREKMQVRRHRRSLPAEVVASLTAAALFTDMSHSLTAGLGGTRCRAGVREGGAQDGPRGGVRQGAGHGQEAARLPRQTRGEPNESGSRGVRSGRGRR